jgi:hypothetical protein
MNNHPGWTIDGKCIVCLSDDSSKPCTFLQKSYDDLLKENLKLKQIINALPKCINCNKTATYHNISKEYDEFSEYEYLQHYWYCDECGKYLHELEYAKKLREYLNEKI